MNRQLTIARYLVTLPAVFLALGPPIIDLSESHILNPLWTAHARLHTVWLISTNALVSLVALSLMWRPGQASHRNSVLLAAMLVGAVLSGFFIASVTQSLYGGSFSDPNGVAITVGPFDANLAVFSLLFILVVAGALLARPSSNEPGRL
jgi:hypothetical protein